MRSRHNACFDRNFCSSMRVTRVRIKRIVLGLHDVKILLIQRRLLSLNMIVVPRSTMNTNGRTEY